MIGGYLSKVPQPTLEEKLSQFQHWSKIPIGKWGFLFHDNCFTELQNLVAQNNQCIALTQDLLVTKDINGEYRPFRLESELVTPFPTKGCEVLQKIISEFRMIIVHPQNAIVWLISQRAGAGRIYYYRFRDGIFFSSDLRVLLQIVPLELNEIALYSILKYGAAPEPITISSNISVVPASHYLEYHLLDETQEAQPYFQFRFNARQTLSEDQEELTLMPAKNALQKTARFLNRYSPSMLLSGGIDSSLFACYLHQASPKDRDGYYCAFGADDAELPFAQQISQITKFGLAIAEMQNQDACQILQEVVKLTDHPFGDFSSLPIAFILKQVRENTSGPAMVIECNGGDDCFGFSALNSYKKTNIKNSVPKSCKKVWAWLSRWTKHWKWKDKEGLWARLASLVDVHELCFYHYFLVRSPMNYLRLRVSQDWDMALSELMESIFQSCSQSTPEWGFEEMTTVRQLMHVNSRLWSAKALSVGESLGLRVVYPYIWQDVLVAQGQIPWTSKIRQGIVKWPLKQLLQEFMPYEFIYRPKKGFDPPLARWLMDPTFNKQVREVLLDAKAITSQMIRRRTLEKIIEDARRGHGLRFPILNFLWSALFTEMWLKHHGH